MSGPQLRQDGDGDLEGGGYELPDSLSLAAKPAILELRRGKVRLFTTQDLMHRVSRRGEDNLRCPKG